MGLGRRIKAWGHGKQHVKGAFDPLQQYGHLAMEVLVWSLEDRGISVTEDVLRDARVESDKYPSLTVKEFVDGYANRRMHQALR